MWGAGLVGIRLGNTLKEDVAGRAGEGKRCQFCVSASHPDSAGK